LNGDRETELFCRSVVVFLGVSTLVNYFDRKYESEAFFDENFGENVHYFRFSNVMVYFSSSSFLFFSLNHISLLLITSPST